MIAIATIYSLCSLCGPNADKCGRYNAHCNVPKKVTNSEKTYKRDLKRWKKEVVQTEKVVNLMEYHWSPQKLSESSITAYFEDSWMD